MKDVAKRVTDPRLKQTLKNTSGIGTEATRANIISGLLNRGYLYKKGRSVHASESAFSIIDAVPAAIADPATTAIREQAFDAIESGQMTLECFIAKQCKWISQLVEHYRTTTLAMHTREAPLPAVRCINAATNRQARCFLVLYSLPRMPGCIACGSQDGNCQSSSKAPSLAP